MRSEVSESDPIGARRRGALLLLAVVVVALSSLHASGTAHADAPDYAEWPSSSSAIGYTDDADFNYGSDESNSADYLEFRTHVIYAGHTIWGGKTDLVARNLGSVWYQWTDVVWFMTSRYNFSSTAVAGDTLCRIWVNQSANICDRYRVRFTEDFLSRTSPQPAAWTYKNTTCHEFGHAVGFGHGNAQSSCMDGGNNADIGWWEYSHVNARY